MEAEFAKMDAFNKKYASGGQVVTDAEGNAYTTKEYQARSTGNGFRDFLYGKGDYAPTVPDNDTLGSALKDTARAGANAIMGTVEMAANFVGGFALPGFPDYVPFLHDYRLGYDTPTFGLTAEVLTGIGALKLLGAAGSTKVTPGFNVVESGVIGEAQGILRSAELGQIRAAHAAGQPLSVNIGGRLVQYEPGLPASGMTMFGENGFLIGREAFVSQAELQKTVLHELYRLNTPTSATGLSGALAAQETKAAFDFAARAAKHVGGN